MMYHGNRLPADSSHEYHALFVIFEKAPNLKLSSTANYSGALWVNSSIHTKLELANEFYV